MYSSSQENKQSPIPGRITGLAIAQRAVRSLGGELWIEGSSDAGTSFVFAIPTHFATERSSIQWNRVADTT